MRLQIPSLQALKLARLKHIAIQCGISSSGTKPVLTTRIEEELALVVASRTAIARGQDDDRNSTKSRGGRRIKDQPQQQQRILSIDMGIRNLAYCIFDRPSTTTAAAAQTAAAAAAPNEKKKNFAIRAWRCISVSARPAKTSSSSTTTTITTTPPTPTKESFEPSIYAQHAYTFLSTIVHSHRPTQVLIERQRYRSMSSAAVQEWTVRVNMFEGMLYAVLRTLLEEGKWAGVVHGVSPLKVTSFWTGGGGDGGDGGNNNHNHKASKVKTAKARNKAAKVDLVGRWLERNVVLECSTEDARRAADVYLERWKGKGKRKGGRRRRKSQASVRGAEEEEEDAENDEVEDDGGITKLDDQADCLLQGVAWLRWEENKLRVLRHGIEALDAAGSEG
ncbi:MAG: hypothetical protein M1816_005867 [Peltula sp. TS41687]|nr:MAG: hypothetical protein M1816_005867 [Peltula sp. TS41687]